MAVGMVSGSPHFGHLARLPAYSSFTRKVAEQLGHETGIGMGGTRGGGRMFSRGGAPVGNRGGGGGPIFQRPGAKGRGGEPYSLASRPAVAGRTEPGEPTMPIYIKYGDIK